MLRTRQRRSTENSNVFYKMHAFGKDLHLNLALNDKLMSPGLQFEQTLPSGDVSMKPVPKNTFYLGHVSSDPDSLVAVSNDEGLVSNAIICRMSKSNIKLSRFTQLFCRFCFGLILH